MKVQSKPTIKYNLNSVEEQSDLLAIEEPLEIRITFLQNSKRIEKALSVTMRTPGNDEELTMGFLFTEGIIKSPDDVISIKHCLQVPSEAQGNVIRANLKDDVEINWDSLQRHFYTSSSCGVCGKSALENISCELPKREDSIFRVKKSIIDSLSEIVKEAQQVFNFTGGIHAAAIFDENGTLLCLREDIGRHNAVDKVIGYTASNNFDSTHKQIIWVSGRASFELVQKALMAGFKMLVSVGAPSSLAVDLAVDNELIVLGFTRNQRFNVYSGTNIMQII